MYEGIIQKLTGLMQQAMEERNHWKDKNDFYFEYWEGEAVAYAEALNVVIDAKMDMEVG